jgi:hypothetical protein
MNEIEAREVLGASKSATFKELKAAYRKLIILVHPDTAEKDELSQARAREATSRLNLAWEYIENREKSGSLGEEDYSDNSKKTYGRNTRSHECDLCGYAPAIKVSAPMITTFYIFFRRGKYELNSCRSCGLAISRMALRETLIKGWWGIGIFFVPQAIYKYFQNCKLLSKIDFPKFRDPEVVTMSSFPLAVLKSPLKEPLPILTSLTAGLILAFIVFSGGSSSNSTQSASSYFGEVGTCYEEVSSSDGDKIQMIDCSASNATLRSIAVTDEESMCPIGTLFTTVANLPDGTVKTACLTTF